jgi:methionyl-tRNA formyltransferase
MRILFFGTSEFGIPALRALQAGERFNVVAVVTQPDRPHGRGLRPAPSPVKKAAQEAGLPLLQPRRVRSERFLSTAREMRPDALVVAAFGQIIPASLLELPSLGPVNIHASLLPLYRGAAPIQRAILQGEIMTGVTTMWMDASLDTGDILLQRSIPVSLGDDAGSLGDKLAALGGELLIETLDLLAVGRCPRRQQDHSLATYAPAIRSEDASIRWDEAATQVRDRIRALSPRPGAYTALGGRRIKVWKAGVAPDSSPGAPATVERITGQRVCVRAGEGVVELVEVQPENSRRMTAAEWARGARLMVGARFDHG